MLPLGRRSLVLSCVLWTSHKSKNKAGAVGTKPHLLSVLTGWECFLRLLAAHVCPWTASAVSTPPLSRSLRACSSSFYISPFPDGNEQPLVRAQHNAPLWGLKFSFGSRGSLLFLLQKASQESEAGHRLTMKLLARLLRALPKQECCCLCNPFLRSHSSLEVRVSPKQFAKTSCFSPASFSFIHSKSNIMSHCQTSGGSCVEFLSGAIDHIDWSGSNVFLPVRKGKNNRNKLSEMKFQFIHALSTLLLRLPSRDQ